MQGALSILAVLGCACKAELPNQLAQDSSPSFPCSTFADILVAYNPPSGEDGSSLGQRALAAPDQESVTMAANATLTVGFLGLGGIIDETGDDLRVHGTVVGELAVYAGSNLSDLTFSGSLTQDALTIDIDVGSVSSATYIQLVGLSGEASVDAFESLQTRCP